jgi:hypothetical protein
VAISPKFLWLLVELQCIKVQIVQWHIDIRVLREYLQTTKEFFRMEKLKTRNRKAVFFNGMEAAA